MVSVDHRTPAFEPQGFTYAVKHSKWLPYVILSAIYVLTTSLTNAHFLADTADYANSILSYTDFVEFGHLFWRPVGWLAYHLLLPIIHWFVVNNEQVAATVALMTINYVAGLCSLFLVFGIVKRFVQRPWVLYASVIAFFFSQGVLNYSQTGTAYVPGLTLVLLSLFLLISQGGGTKVPLYVSVCAGLVLGAALCLWFPYVLAVPAVLASPLFLWRVDKARLWLVMQTFFAFAVTYAVGLGVAIVYLKLFSVAEVAHWVVTTSSGGSNTSGLSRAIFGFSRSFINMGNDGVLFKRYLLHDPFNPVSPVELFRLSLWKLGLFYLSLAAVLINLSRVKQGKRILGLLIANAIPVFVFAVLFDGGAIERYLPLYPAFFLALALSLGGDRAIHWLKIPVCLFIVALAFTNSNEMAKTKLDIQQEMAVARLESVMPLLRPNSIFIVPHQMDELVLFNRSYPFHPLNQDHRFSIYPIVIVGSSWVPNWRKDLVVKVQDSWNKGGDVWISTRLFKERPHAEWNWVEGTDPRISWKDIWSLSSQLETETSVVGGTDGFVRLKKSGALLESLTSPTP